jgi:hypothetical protein
LRVAWWAEAALLLLAWPVTAQVRTGEVTSSLNGTIAPGYSADFGNTTGSDHSWVLGGVANYSGSFYNPNFLSFNASVFLNQSRANSNYQSISDASGVNASASIFGGSRFPGSVSYTKTFNSEGSYNLPGLPNYVTHGNSDAFGINWSENIPKAPSFSAGFQTGSSQYSVYGTNDTGASSFHSLNLHSSYSILGINMGAYYTTGGGHALIPQFEAGEQNSETHSGNSDYGFNIGHRIPLNGSASASINRSEYNSDYLGSGTTGTIDLINAIVSMHPLSKLSISADANYSDNLNGQLIEPVVAAGGAVPEASTNQPSNSLDLMGVASYSLFANLQTSAFVERRSQVFMGDSYGMTSYGGSGTFSHAVLNGNFNASLNATGNTDDQTGEDTLGFSTIENYSSEILGWHVNGSFGYAQNVQTLLITYMNSSYNYTGNVRRRWGKLNASVGVGASRTALTQQAGTANSSQSYNANLGYGQWITATGSYSKASGQALATGAGLVSVPVPSPVLPANLVSLFGGDGYSFGLSSNPMRGLILTASYAKSASNTSNSGAASTNQNSEFNSLVQYQFRKMNFTSGYSRLEQGFSGSGTQPEVTSSFYIGVSRWFNFF